MAQTPWMDRIWTTWQIFYGKFRLMQNQSTTTNPTVRQAVGLVMTIETGRYGWCDEASPKSLFHRVNMS